MPSFHPANGYALDDSMTAGRTMVNLRPDDATICSPIALVYV
jgi:hypothetical protein